MYNHEGGIDFLMWVSAKKADKLVVLNVILKTKSITSSNTQTAAKRHQVLDFSAVFFHPLNIIFWCLTFTRTLFVIHSLCKLEKTWLLTECRSQPRNVCLWCGSVVDSLEDTEDLGQGKRCQTILNESCSFWVALLFSFSSLPAGLQSHNFRNTSFHKLQSIRIRSGGKSGVISELPTMQT